MDLSELGEILEGPSALEASTVVAEAIGFSSSLRTLTFTNMKMECLEVLIRVGVGTNASLQKLELGCINISAEGAKALAEAVKVKSTLQQLYLDNNNISDEGAKALAEALKVNTVIIRLYRS